MRVVLVISEDDSLAAGLRAAIEGSHLVLSEPSMFDATAQLRLLDTDLLVVDGPERHSPEALAALRDASPSALKAACCHRPVPNMDRAAWDLVLDGTKPENTVDRLLHLLAGPSEPEPEPLVAVSEPFTTRPADRTALRWIPRLTRALEPTERFAEALADAVSDMLDPVRVAVLLPSPTGVRIAAALGVSGPVREGVLLGPDSSLIQWMLAKPGLCSITEADADTARELALLGMSLALPLSWDGPLPGLIVLGGPSHGMPYAIEELDALQALARAAGALRAALKTSHKDISTPDTPTEMAPAPQPAHVIGTTAWEHLAARVAEGVKDPLLVINTYAQLLPERIHDPGFRATCSEAVQQEVARINTVVETLFEFARRPRLVPQQADLNDTVRETLSSFEEEFRAHMIRIETHFDPNSPQAEVDPIYFAQALHHVVRNAIEAMPCGGLLTVTTEDSPDGHQVCITDSGPGVPEDVRQDIFLPFFTTRENAAGLGLAVAERILCQHAGTLTLAQHSGSGATFVFRLPPIGYPHGNDTGH